MKKNICKLIICFIVINSLYGCSTKQEETTMICKLNKIENNVHVAYSQISLTTSNNRLLELINIEDTYLGVSEDPTLDSKVDLMAKEYISQYKDNRDLQVNSYVTKNTWHKEMIMNLRNPKEETLQLFNRDAFNEDGTVSYSKILDELKNSKYSCRPENDTSIKIEDLNLKRINISVYENNVIDQYDNNIYTYGLRIETLFNEYKIDLKENEEAYIEIKIVPMDTYVHKMLGRIGINNNPKYHEITDVYYSKNEAIGVRWNEGVTIEELNTYIENINGAYIILFINDIEVDRKLVPINMDIY